MQDWIKRLLQPGSGLSTMRVMGLSALIVGSGLAIAGLIMKVDLYGLATLCGVFIGAAFTGKVMQKKVEAPQDPSK